LQRGSVWVIDLTILKPHEAHVSAAIQSKKHPVRGDTIQYIYTDSKHNNPLYRVTPIENTQSLPHFEK